MKFRYFVGIDVAKATLDIAVLQEDGSAWQEHIDNTTASISKTLVMEIMTSSVITCPHCGFQKEEVMPTDACRYFYRCTNCKAVLKPKGGDCCVFCSYGMVPCPPIQANRNCCG